MNHYERVTDKDCNKTIGKAQHDSVFNRAVLITAWDLENKIESGEIGDVSEWQRKVEVLKVAIENIKGAILTACSYGTPNVEKMIENLFELSLMQAEKEIDNK